MKLRLLLLATSLGALGYALAFGRSGSIDELQALYAGVVIVLGMVPAMVSLVDAEEARLIPLMTLHGLFYSLTFGLPALSEKTRWFSDAESITDGLLMTVLGLLCLFVGYYASRTAFRKMKSIRFLGRVDPESRKWIAWILFGAYGALLAFPALGLLSSIRQLADPLGYLSIGILAALWLDGTLARGHFGLLLIAIVGTFVVKLLSGSLAQPVLFLVFLGIVYWNRTRRLPWRMMLLSMAIVVLLNPVKGAYRAETWSVDADALSTSQKAEIFWDAAEKYYLDADRQFIDDPGTVNRLAHIAVLSYVISTTPDPVPYWMGGSYRTLWTSFIPRLLWPDKPQATIGQEFGHRYMLLGDSDETTSFNLPWLPEFYANFGLLGVIFGMFGVGVLFRFLVQKFTAPPARVIEHILGVAITFQLFYAESNFALMIGGLLLTYVAVVVLLRGMMMGSRRRGDAMPPIALRRAPPG